MEIVGGILIFVFYPRVQTAILDSINKYDEKNQDNVVTIGWNTFQATVSPDRCLVGCVSDVVWIKLWRLAT